MFGKEIPMDTALSAAGSVRKNSLMEMKEAFALVLDNSLDLEVESVFLNEASGRFLSDPVKSPIDSPPFDKAAMDGYAVCREDADSSRGEFEILETVAAGEVPEKELTPGTCVKIMTGAELPPDAAKVIRVEYTGISNGKMKIMTPEPYENIIRKGENLKKGDLFMPVKRLGSGDIGSLAASGIDRVDVRRRLKIGVITTGSELTEPGKALAPGGIYNSSGFQLAAQIEDAGCIPVSYGIIPDNPLDIAGAVDSALAECDILLLTGGVSRGDYDFVPDILKDAGMEILFHGLKVKPGRPALFGRRPLEEGSGRAGFVFGLPGNPVSTYILFDVLVKAFIYQLNGLNYRPGVVQGRLAAEIKRRDTERMEFRPVRITGSPSEAYGIEAVSERIIEPVRYMGSAHLNALVETDGLVVLEPGRVKVEKGSIVNVRLI